MITYDDIPTVQDEFYNRPKEVLSLKTPNELLLDISSDITLGYGIQE